MKIKMGAEETWNQTNSIKIKVYSGGSWSSSSITSIIILLFFFFLIIYLFCCARSSVGAGGILVGQMGFHSLTRDQTWGPLHWECRQSLSHWTTREVPPSTFLPGFSFTKIQGQVEPRKPVSVSRFFNLHQSKGSIPSGESTEGVHTVLHSCPQVQFVLLLGLSFFRTDTHTYWETFLF